MIDSLHRFADVVPFLLRIPTVPQFASRSNPGFAQGWFKGTRRETTLIFITASISSIRNIWFDMLTLAKNSEQKKNTWWLIIIFPNFKAYLSEISMEKTMSSCRCSHRDGPQTCFPQAFSETLLAAHRSLVRCRNHGVHGRSVGYNGWIRYFNISWRYLGKMSIIEA